MKSEIERAIGGAGGWPLVPSKAFPGEQTLACPRCESTDVTLTCAYGPGGRLGDPGSHEINRCNACGYVTRWSVDEPVAAQREGV